MTRFVRKFRKPAFPWVNGFFEANTLGLGGTVSRFVLAQSADFDDPDTVLQPGVKIHRCQFRGAFQYNTNSVAVGYVDWLWGVWKEDADETDNMLWNGAGNMFLQRPMYRWGYGSYFVTGKGAGVATDAFSKDGIVPARFDIRFRRPLELRGDERLVLGHSFLSNVGGAGGLLGSALLTGAVRLSIQSAATGR